MLRSIKSSELPRGRVTLRDVRPEPLTAELARVSKILGSTRPFAPVGFDHVNNVVWVIDRAGHLRGIPVRQLRRQMLISLCGAEWLLSKYPEHWKKTGEATGHFDADKAIDGIVSACQAMGYFDGTRPHTPSAVPSRGI
jgi:hypothetical protein